MWNSTEVIIWDLSAVHRPVLKHTHTRTHTHAHTHSRALHSRQFISLFIISLFFHSIHSFIHACAHRPVWDFLCGNRSGGTDAAGLTSCSLRRRCLRWPGRDRTRARWRSRLSRRWTRSSRTSLQLLLMMMMMRSGGERRRLSHVCRYAVLKRTGPRARACVFPVQICSSCGENI